MKKRDIEIVVAARDPHYVGDGFRVHNFIPSFPLLNMNRMDPFIFLDYNSKFYFPATSSPRGVELHPHRGFETVTILYSGKVSHKDSEGNSGTIEEGEVQRMTAGSGVLHQEFHEENWAKKGGDFHAIQLWVNLAKKDKMTKPKYQTVTKDKMEKYFLENDMGVLEIISGEYKDKKGYVKTFSPINLFNAKLKKGAKIDFSFKENYNTALLVVGGKIKVNGEDEVSESYFILMQNDGQYFEIEALTDETIVFVMSGEPLNEPIYASGPFVMNTQEEVSQAYRDYHSGKF
ncbi:pirin family protein [Candidatus Gracilibacteria bacterium]|nr:MAG: pirin family protein [Candidatus Gracilibacteria bacterium]